MLSTAAKLGIAGLGVAGLWWLMYGFGGASVGDAAAATAAGTQAGCDLGTKDAKQGNPEAMNPVDDSVKGLASKYGAASDAYLKAFQAAYSDCYAKNVPPPTKVVTPAPAPKAPVATAYLDRFSALNIYLQGARDGAKDGFKDRISGGSSNYDPNSGAIGTGIPKAYRAGYVCGYGNGYAQAKVFDGMSPILVPDYLPKEQENNIVDSICAAQFGSWYDAHKSDASVAGVGAAVGWGRIGNVALVGARRPPIDVDRLHAGMTLRPSSRYGWPAPPEDEATSTLYRSF